MKICIHSKLPHQILRQALEIRIDATDRSSLPSLLEQYPQAAIIQELYNLTDEQINWTELRDLAILYPNRLIICTTNIPQLRQALSLNIPSYIGYQANSPSEANSLLALGVCYINVGIPLFFQLEGYKNCGTPFRTIANIPYLDNLPHDHGICGQWLRPEDLDSYERRTPIQAIDFFNVPPQKEEALFRIYTKKEWPGPLSDIIEDLNYSAENRLILPELAHQRISCNQICALPNHNCHKCQRMLTLANPNSYTFL